MLSKLPFIFLIIILHVASYDICEFWMFTLSKSFCYELIIFITYIIITEKSNLKVILRSLKVWYYLHFFGKMKNVPTFLKSLIIVHEINNIGKLCDFSMEPHSFTKGKAKVLFFYNPENQSFHESASHSLK